MPVFNEERNVLPAYEAVIGVFDRLKPRYSVEFVFTDNHSTDRTYDTLEQLAAKDPRVKVVRFNRNYGFQRSLMTGYRYAVGEAAVQLDCDLQDPPELITNFLELWERGHDVVVGLRRRREEASLLTWTRGVFYKLLDRISEDRLTPNAGDFRLVDKKIIAQLRTLNHATPYVRGLISSLATNEVGIIYDRRGRKFEKSKFPVRRLIGFALHGIVSHSVLPLRLASYVGILVSLATFVLGLFYVVTAVFFRADWPRGFATIVVLILFGISLNGIFVGILGEYVGRIHTQLLTKPLTVVERTCNLGEVNGK
jgi:dolichol-phosphate mannosyltransferase